ncbi:MAG: DUF262 domain-containing protein [Actinomycetes bacterium]
MSTITAGTITVRTLFEKRKKVPAYQRDYAWSPTLEISALLDDLFEHFGLPPEGVFASGQEDDYLLGPIVVTSEPVPEVIDGQQRVLTLFLLLAGLRARLLELGASDSWVNALSSALVDFDDRENRDAPRIRHHDDLANTALITVASYVPGTPRPKGTNASLSHRRLVHGFNHILDRITDDLPSDPEKVWDFAMFVRNSVKLIEIATDDVGQALVVFERANFRGRPLDPSDLLKNLIFQNAPTDAFASLSTTWRSLQTAVDETKQVQIIDFLRWYHLAQAGGFYSTKRNFYVQIRKHVDENGMDARAYVDSLEAKAVLLRQMAMEVRNPASGALSPYLAGIRRLGGMRQKQHWPLLLAVATWDAAHFETVARGLERLLFFSYVTDYRSQALERDIRSLTERARSLPPGDESVLVLAGAIDSVAAEIRKDGLYEERFLRLTYDEAKPVVSIVLRKLHDGVFRVYRNSTLMGANADSPEFASSQIEHIWPQSDGNALMTETADDVVHRIGNLVLLDASVNASGGATAALQKLSGVYRDSDDRYLIAKSLASRPEFASMGPEVAPRRAADLCPTGFGDWGPDQIRDLGTAYRELLDRVMPPLVSDEGGELKLTPTE